MNAMNPDCRDGKHDACSGTAWDIELDEITTCRCECNQCGKDAK